MADPITGKDGKIMADSSAVEHVRNWSITKESDNKTYTSSSTSGWQKTAAGNKKWSGSFEIYLQNGAVDLAFDEGDLVAGEFYTDAAVHYYAGNVRVDSIEVSTDIEGAELVPATVNFTGDGALVETGGVC